ncbi:MAG: hypothetical protein ACXWA3_16440 [Acidimicrobiales bacterium]
MTSADPGPAAEPGSGHESELEHLRETIDSSEELPGRGDNDREIHLVTFFLVVLVVEVFDVLLGTRLRFADTLNSTASTVAEVLDRGGDALFALFGLLAVLTLVAARRATPRFALPVMVGYLSVATVNVIADVATLVGTAHLERATQLALLWDVGLVYLSTTLVFSLWYQLADAYLPGGAIDFPPNGAHPDSPPRWFDYLFLSFNTNATFGPTTENVRTRPTKALMMLQALISLIVLVVLIARVVGLTT